MGWPPRRRISSVLGGVFTVRTRHFGGRRPYHFHDERQAASGRWELWMGFRCRRRRSGAPRTRRMLAQSPLRVRPSTVARLMTARRCLTLLVSALLVAPASAHADFSETPTYDFTGEPSCLAPTGAPGEVAIGATPRRAPAAGHARRVGAQAGEVKAGEGFSRGADRRAAVGRGRDRPGHAVLRRQRRRGGARPGRGVERAAVDRRARGLDAAEPWSAAVSDRRGDVVVAWLGGTAARPESQIRVRLARRACTGSGRSGPPAGRAHHDRHGLRAGHRRRGLRHG